MPFDPSALQDIQPPDIVGGIAKGYQLKDMVDSQQLNRLKLNSEKATLAEDQATNDIIKRGDMSTDAGRAKVQEEVNRVSPRRAMELGKYAQSVQSGELDTQLKKVELHTAAQDVIAGSVDKIWQQATAMKGEKTADGRPRYTEASINAWIQGQVPLAISNIQSDSGLPEQVRKTALQGVQQFTAQQQAITYDTLTQVERSTKLGRDQLKSLRDDLTAQTGAKRESETERHNQAIEGQGQQRIGQAGQRMNRMSNGLLDEDSKTYIAAQLRAGDTTVLQGLSSADKAAVRRRYVELEEDDGRTPEEAAAKTAEFFGLRAGERAAGTRQAQVSMAGNEAYNMIDLAKKASDAVPRGSFVPLTRAEQVAKTAGSDPSLARFVAANTSLVNAYARAISPTGQPHDSDKEHAREMLNTAQSQEAYDAVLSQMKAEIEAAKRAPAQVQAELKQGVTGKAPEVGPKAGAVENGYRFKGGDPAKRENWEKAGG